MTDAVHRFPLSSEQLLEERVELSLRAPVMRQAIRLYRVVFVVLAALSLVLALLTWWTVPVGPDGLPVHGPSRWRGVPLLVLAAISAACGVQMSALLRYFTRVVERRVWAYAGDDGAAVEVSAAGIALDAPGRSTRTGWSFYDDVLLDSGGLELRRRGGPVGFYPTAALGGPAGAAALAHDVRRWIDAARAVPPRA